MQWLNNLPAVFGDDALTQSIVSCCTRLTTSELFEDKVSALNELENLAKEHPLVRHQYIIPSDLSQSFWIDKMLTHRRYAVQQK